MKKSIVVAVAAIVAALGVGLAVAKTVGILYGDQLVIPYSGTQTAGITSAGVVSGTQIKPAGAVTIYSRTKAQITVDSADYNAGDLYFCSDCVAKLSLCTVAGTMVSISTGTFQ